MRDIPDSIPDAEIGQKLIDEYRAGQVDGATVHGQTRAWRFEGNPDLADAIEQVMRVEER